MSHTTGVGRITFPGRFNVCRGRVRVVFTAQDAQWCLMTDSASEVAEVIEMLTCRHRSRWAAIGAVRDETIYGKTLRIMYVRAGTRFALLDDHCATVREFVLDMKESTILARFLSPYLAGSVAQD